MQTRIDLQNLYHNDALTDTTHNAKHSMYKTPRLQKQRITYGTSKKYSICTYNRAHGGKRSTSLNMAINSKTLSISFFWSFLEQGGSSIVSLLVQIILARLLLPDAFGVMAILLVIINLVNTLAQSGFGSALIQKKNASRITFSTAFWLSMALSLVLYIAVFFISPFIAEIYKMPDLVLYIRILGLSVFLESFNSIQRSFLQKDMQFKSLFRANFFAITFGAAVSIAMALAGFGIWSLIGQVLSQAGTACIILLVQIPWKPSFNFDSNDARFLFDYGWKVCLTSVLNTFYIGLSELVIGKSNTAAELGFYSQGRKWPIAAMGAMNNALQNVIFPALTELQDDKAAFKSAIRKALSSGFYIICPICFLATIVAEPIVALLLGSDWLPCVLIFQFTCLGYVLLMPQVLNLRAYMALGHSGLYLKLQTIKVVSGALIFCLVAIISKNIYVVSAAVLIHTSLCILLVDMAPAKRIHGVSALEQVRIILPTIALSIAASAIAAPIQVLHLDYLPQMIIQIIVFLVVFFSISKFTHHSGLNECLNILKQFTKRK